MSGIIQDQSSSLHVLHCEVLEVAKDPPLDLALLGHCQCHWYAGSAHSASEVFRVKRAGKTVRLDFCTFIVSDVGHDIDLKLTVATVEGEHLAVYFGQILNLASSENFLRHSLELRNVHGVVATAVVYCASQQRWTVAGQEALSRASGEAVAVGQDDVQASFVQQHIFPNGPPAPEESEDEAAVDDDGESSDRSAGTPAKQDELQEDPVASQTSAKANAPALAEEALHPASATASISETAATMATDAEASSDAEAQAAPETSLAAAAVSAKTVATTASAAPNLEAPAAAKASAVASTTATAAAKDDAEAPAAAAAPVVVDSVSKVSDGVTSDEKGEATGASAATEASETETATATLTPTSGQDPETAVAEASRVEAKVAVPVEPKGATELQGTEDSNPKEVRKSYMASKTKEQPRATQQPMTTEPPLNVGQSMEANMSKTAGTSHDQRKTAGQAESAKSHKFVAEQPLPFEKPLAADKQNKAVLQPKKVSEWPKEVKEDDEGFAELMPDLSECDEDRGSDSGPPDSDAELPFPSAAEAKDLQSKPILRRPSFKDSRKEPASSATSMGHCVSAKSQEVQVQTLGSGKTQATRGFASPRVGQLRGRAQRALMQDCEDLVPAKRSCAATASLLDTGLAESQGPIWLSGSTSLRDGRRRGTAPTQTRSSASGAGKERWSWSAPRSQSGHKEDEDDKVEEATSPASQSTYPSPPLGGWAVDPSKGRWFRVVAMALSIRRHPQVDAPLAGEFLRGEVFEASASTLAEDGFAFLEISSGRGWVFSDARVQPVKVLDDNGEQHQSERIAELDAKETGSLAGKVCTGVQTSETTPRNLGLAMQKSPRTLEDEDRNGQASEVEPEPACRWSPRISESEASSCSHVPDPTAMLLLQPRCAATGTGTGASLARCPPVSAQAASVPQANSSCSTCACPSSASRTFHPQARVAQNHAQPRQTEQTRQTKAASNSSTTIATTTSTTTGPELFDKPVTSKSTANQAKRVAPKAIQEAEQGKRMEPHWPVQGRQPVRANHSLSALSYLACEPPEAGGQGESGDGRSGDAMELRRSLSARPASRTPLEALEEQQRLQAALLKVALRVHPTSSRMTDNRRASSQPPSQQWAPRASLECAAMQRQIWPTSSSGSSGVRRQQSPVWSRHSVPNSGDVSTPASGPVRCQLPEWSRSSLAPGGAARAAQGSVGAVELSGSFLAAMRGQTTPLTPRRAPPEGFEASTPTEVPQAWLAARRRCHSAPGSARRQALPSTWQFSDILLPEWRTPHSHC